MQTKKRKQTYNKRIEFKMMDLSQKKALVLGVANQRSLAFAIARQLAQAGAQVGITYQNERLAKRVHKLSKQIQSDFCLPCDVLEQQDLEQLFKHIEEQWSQIDILVHSIAFAPMEEFAGPFFKTSREGFNTAFNSSVYSLIEVSRRSLPLMQKQGGSIITLTFGGSQRVIPNYKLMGPVKAALEASVKYLAYEFGAFKIRVNAISAGPIKTLSSAAIANFNEALELMEQKTPLQSNVDADDVAQLALFLASSNSKKITGSILYVDSGANIMGI